MSKALKLSALAAAALFALAQFVRPARFNPPVVAGQSIEERAALTPAAREVLERSCMDCHSNRSDWPWYSNVAPVSWYVVDHVDHGRSHLNFSEWASYDPAEAAQLLKQICGTARAGTMPLGSYTLVHRDARLSQEDVKSLCDWAAAESGRLSANIAR